MPYTFSELEQIAAYAESSGLFGGGQKLTKSQALMRILRGQELGLAPTIALGGIWFSRGKLICDAGTTALLLSMAGYEIESTENTPTTCSMRMIRVGKPVSPLVTFTMDEARKAGLVKGGGAWESWPQDMLWARCLTRLARRYAPHIFGGSVYAPGEIDDLPEAQPERIVPQMIQHDEPRRATAQELTDALSHLRLVAVTKLGCDANEVKAQLLAHAGVSRVDQLTPQQITIFCTQRYDGILAIIEMLKEDTRLESLRETYGCYGLIPWDELVELLPENAPQRQDGNAATDELFGTTTGIIAKDERTQDDDVPY
jgi:hypothetical protein